MNIATIGLTGRILLLGLERIVVKRLGTGTDPVATAFHLFSIGALSIAPWCLNEKVVTWDFLGPMAVASLIYAAAFILYVRSLAKGDASLVSPLYNFNVFFLSIGAWLFLGESLTVTKIAGLVFLLAGASFVTGESSFGRSIRSLYTNVPCRHMVGASLLIAVGRIIDKALVSDVTAEVYALTLYLSISFWLFLFLLIGGKTKEIISVFSSRPALAITCGLINGYSYVLMLLALNAYDVSIVEPLSMLGMLLTMGLSKVILNETLGNRVIGAVIMIGGAALLFV